MTLRFGFGRALGSFFLGDQRLPVGNRNLIIIGMNFTEGEKAVAISAVIDKSRLQRRFNPSHLGQIDIAAQLPAAGRLKVELLHPLATQNDHPGLFRMGRIDKHFVWHLPIS